MELELKSARTCPKITPRVSNSRLSGRACPQTPLECCGLRPVMSCLLYQKILVTPLILAWSGKGSMGAWPQKWAWSKFFARALSYSILTVNPVSAPGSINLNLSSTALCEDHTQLIFIDTTSGPYQFNVSRTN